MKKHRKTIRKLIQKKELLLIKSKKAANTVQIMKKIIPFYIEHLQDKS